MGFRRGYRFGCAKINLGGVKRSSGSSYEMLAEPQRDLTPEKAALRLRDLVAR